MRGITVLLFSIIGSLTINHCLGQACKDNKKLKVHQKKKCAAVSKLPVKQLNKLCSKNWKVKNYCKATCGFCPCKNLSGKFKIGSKTYNSCKKAPKSQCQNSAIMKKRCPIKCNSCKKNGSTCVLQASLAYPYKTPNDAPYHGYHTCWMAAYKGDSETAPGCMSDTTPTWCTYKNSVKGGDSAFLINIDDNYDTEDDEEDFMSSETITIKGAAAKTAGETLTTHFYVYHWFNEESYYDEYDDWDDHKMPPVLKIKVLNKNNDLDNDGDGWSHPIGEESHINDGKDYNPDYVGAFYLGVSCDNKCNCNAQDYSPFPTYYQESS